MSEAQKPNEDRSTWITRLCARMHGTIEASDTETDFLREFWATSGELRPSWERSRESRNEPTHRVSWDDRSTGFYETIGHLAKMPVCVSVRWATVGGALIAFWEATSQVVDYRMIEEWLAKKFPNARHGMDALNFGNLLRDAQAIAKKEAA